MRFGPPMAAIAAVLLASGASALGQGAGASALGRGERAAPGCGPPGARTLAKDPAARVYAMTGSVYGCSKRSHRTTRLGSAGNCLGNGSSVNHIALAGQTVAYGIHTCGTDFGYTQVLVRRLRDGAKLGTFAATEKPLGAESTDYVSSLVVKPDGAAAWIGTGQSIISPARDIEVRTGHGRARQLLDSGSQVKPGSLRLHGSHLTWLHGQTTRSATLN